MLLMLVVLVVFIRYAADPSNWAWVETLDGDAWAETDPPDAPPKGQPDTKAKSSPANPDANPSATKPPLKTEAAKPEPAKPGAKPAAKPEPAVVVETEPAEPPGLTDQDPEEADAAGEELQAVGDRTLFNQPEEMLAYNRLVKWSRNQSFDAMLKRAKRRVVFNDFVQSPDKWRGKLVALDLTACRVLKYEQKPDDNPLYANLYEVWGFSKESQNWLYEAVVVDPPADLPKGPSVQEKVRLVGYFFKIQAYQPAGAKPNQPPLFAPVFIGKLNWAKPVVPHVDSADYLWFGLMAGMFGLIMVAAVGALIFTRRRPRRPPSLVVGTSGLTTDEWLDRAEIGDAPLDDVPDEKPSAASEVRGEGDPPPATPGDKNV
jgi:hypothetical protein